MSDKTEEKKLPEIWVKRNKANFVTIGFKGEISVRINPGLTCVKDQDVLKCIADPKLNINWKAFITNKVHELVSGKEAKSKKETTVFTAMTADDAIKMVKETYSIPALEQLASEEQSSKSRKSVLSAIDDQVTEMKTADTKEQANA